MNWFELFVSLRHLEQYSFVFVLLHQVRRLQNVLIIHDNWKKSKNNAVEWMGILMCCWNKHPETWDV